MKLKDDKRCLIIKGKEGKDYQVISYTPSSPFGWFRELSFSRLECGVHDSVGSLIVGWLEDQ